MVRQFIKLSSVALVFSIATAFAGDPCASLPDLANSILKGGNSPLAAFVPLKNKQESFISQATPKEDGQFFADYEERGSFFIADDGSALSVQGKAGCIFIAYQTLPPGADIQGTIINFNDNGLRDSNLQSSGGSAEYRCQFYWVDDTTQSFGYGCYMDATVNQASQ